MTIVLSEDNMPNVYRLDTHRPMPAGLDQQGRRAVRGFGSRAEFVDTVATDYGSADALGDDRAERYSARGAIDECAAPEGGTHADPVPSGMSRTDGARIGAVLLLISAVSVIGVISAAFLARWPLG